MSKFSLLSIETLFISTIECKMSRKRKADDSGSESNESEVDNQEDNPETWSHEKLLEFAKKAQKEKKKNKSDLGLRQAPSLAKKRKYATKANLHSVVSQTNLLSKAFPDLCNSKTAEKWRTSHARNQWRVRSESKTKKQHSYSLEEKIKLSYIYNSLKVENPRTKAAELERLLEEIVGFRISSRIVLL